MSPTQNLSPTSIGAAAADSLGRARAVCVAGLTSRGVFLQLDQDALVFLSSEREHGPLTINMDCMPRLAKSECGSVTAGMLRLGEYGIHLAGVRVWQPETPPAAQLDRRQQWERLNEISALLLRSSAQADYPLLRAALSLDEGSADQQALREARELLRQGEVEALVDALIGFAGRGVGLTPAGDDLLGGLLLGLSRWGYIVLPNFPVHAFSARLLGLAAPRTSQLSAALLQCAANGQADERLLEALDSLFSEQPGADVCAAGLAKWGSSSGGEALAGMSLILQGNL